MDIYLDSTSSRVARVGTGCRLVGLGSAMPSAASAPTNRTRIDRTVNAATGIVRIPAPGAGWLALTHVPATDHAVRFAAKQAAPPRGVPR